MSGTTTISALRYPTLSDSPNAQTAVKNLADDVDSLVNSRFATTGARDSAITSPVAGQQCYVTSTGEFYMYSGSAWVGMRPRFARATANQTVTDSNALANSTYLTMSVEANSVYKVEADIFYFGDATGGTSNDFKCGWSVPSGVSGLWAPFGVDVGMTGLAGSLYPVPFGWTSSAVLGSANAFFTARMYGTLVTGANAGTLTFQFSENTGVLGVTTVNVASNSLLTVMKVG